MNWAINAVSHLGETVFGWRKNPRNKHTISHSLLGEKALFSLLVDVHSLVDHLLSYRSSLGANGEQVPPLPLLHGALGEFLALSQLSCDLSKTYFAMIISESADLSQSQPHQSHFTNLSMATFSIALSITGLLGFFFFFTKSKNGISTFLVAWEADMATTGDWGREDVRKHTTWKSYCCCA